MIDPATRARVRTLVTAVRERPTEFPLAEVTDLAASGVRVEIDREGPEALVYVGARPDPRFDALSPREYEVATLIAAGFSNGQIADALFITLGTVKDHVHAILTKTGLTSRVEVAACWYGRGR